MQFRVLGSLEAGADGAVAELGPPKQRALLAILLLRVGEIVPVDRLIELLWGDDAPRTATHSIQTYVSDLRRALEPFGGSGLIVTRPPGYSLETERDSIDAWRFERLVDEGARQLEAGDREGGRSALRGALSLWRGPALAEFAYEEFAQPYIGRLNGRHVDAIEALAAADLEAGRTTDVVRLLEATLLEDPLRERLRELLMLALYRSGRHADALRTYDALRILLAEELSVDPSPSIRRLYDRILLHDPSLLPVAEADARSAEGRNPYKGLRAFTEQDASDFFGRDDLVERMLAALAGGARLVALVGPSGAGKSSVLAAGLVPRIRAGALPGSERWRTVRLVPGPNLARDVEAVVVRARVPDGGQAEAAGHAVTPDGDRTLLIIDQFEQVFALSETGASDRFLSALADAVTDPNVRLQVVLTLRADCYDRPLLHPRFASVFIPGVMHAVPMTPRELEAAVVEPARREAVEVEPALLAELVADAAGRPGSLPLLQYTLTELFDQRTGAVLTRAGYATLGGLRGLVSRRAESLYLGLDDDAQTAARHVFLRLVRPGDGVAESGRRLALAELTDLGVDPVVLSEVLTAFGRHRLLTFDRDPAAGQATVELAHEALLVEWDRLASWIDQHRAALQRRGVLATAAEEWELSGRNPDYLLAGSRLGEFEPWRDGSVLPLSGRERAFLEAAVERRRSTEAAESARVEAQRRSERGTRRRLAALGLAVVVLAAGLGYALVAGIGRPTTRVVLFASQASVVDAILEAAFDRGVGDFGLSGRKIEPLDFPDLGDRTRELRDISAEAPALVIMSDPALDTEAIAREFPEAHYLVFDYAGVEPNVAYVVFREWEGAYLAGVAAALRTETRTIGFVGGWDWLPIWGFQAGYADGARAADPSVRVVTTYLTGPPVGRPPDPRGFTDAALAEDAARTMFAGGADVVFSVAGEAGLGVFDAAVEMSQAQGRQLWAIGSDSDQYETVARLPGVTKADEWRPHILTSMLKRFDLAVYSALEDAAAGSFSSGVHVMDLASGGVDIAYSGGFIDDLRPQIEGYRVQIVAGDIAVPCIPVDRVDAATAAAEAFGVTLEEWVEGLGCALSGTGA